MSNSSSANPPLVFVLDNVRSGFNVGSAFRTSDGLGVGALYLCGMTPQPPHKEIKKSGLGAEDSVPFHYFEKTQTALEHLKKQGYTLVAAEQTDKALPLETLQKKYISTPSAIIFGHEVWGIKKEVLDLADFHVEIKQSGTKRSLNVASCIAIFAWEWRKNM